MTRQWLSTPVDMSDMDLSGDKLKAHWDAMHAGNLEPFPADERLQDAWRQYHLGNFAKAADIGEEIGGHGLIPAAFATTIYAQYVETDPKRKPELFKEAQKMCETAISAGIKSANLQYMYAVSMGRYSQFISMVEALAQGFGGMIKNAVEACLEISPNHAEGNLTYGGWHASITDQAGGLMARMIYGATQDGAHEYFDRAVELAPDSVVCLIEYARGIETMYGDTEKAKAIELLQKAMSMTATDAMQRLDLTKGKEQLARLEG